MRGTISAMAVVARYPTELGMMKKPWNVNAESLAPDTVEGFSFPCRRGSGVTALLDTYL